MPSTLTPFHHELLSAWHVFRNRWATVVKLSLLPLVPLLFVLPALIDQSMLPPENAAGLGANHTSQALMLIGMLGLLGSVILSTAAKAGIFITVARRDDLGARRALREGFRRFFPFLFTEILASLLVFLALLPFMFFTLWYTVGGGRTMLGEPLTGEAVGILMFAALLLLLIPGLLFAVWFAFAPLATVVKDAPGGIPALRESFRLVAGHSWDVLARLGGGGLLYLAATIAVSPLPIANWLLPFLLALYGTAFFIVIYRELRGQER